MYRCLALKADEFGDGIDVGSMYSL